MRRIKIKELKRTYNLSVEKKGGFFSVFIYRKISIVATGAFAIFGLSPNFVTILSFLFGLMAFAFFSFGDRNMILLGLIPFNISHVLDLSDGQLAILENKKTKLGEFLDPFLDTIKGTLIIGGLAYSNYVITNEISVIALYIFLILTFYFGEYLDNFATKIGITTSVNNLRKAQSIFHSKIKRYIRWDAGFTAVFITFFVILDEIPIMLTIYMVVYAIPRMITLMQILKFLNSK